MYTPTCIKNRKTQDNTSISPSVKNNPPRQATSALHRLVEPPYPRPKAIKRPRTRSAAARQVSNAHERDLVTNKAQVNRGGLRKTASKLLPVTQESLYQTQERQTEQTKQVKIFGLYTNERTKNKQTIKVFAPGC